MERTWCFPADIRKEFCARRRGRRSCGECRARCTQELSARRAKSSAGVWFCFLTSKDSEKTNALNAGIVRLTETANGFAHAHGKGGDSFKAFDASLGKLHSIVPANFSEKQFGREYRSVKRNSLGRERLPERNRVDPFWESFAPLAVYGGATERRRRPSDFDAMKNPWSGAGSMPIVPPRSASVSTRCQVL